MDVLVCPPLDVSWFAQIFFFFQYTCCTSTLQPLASRFLQSEISANIHGGVVSLSCKYMKTLIKKKRV
jgi:hypothetical protein